MDAAGAEALRLGLGAAAPAVGRRCGEGRQPPVDPDSYALRELRGDERVYQAEVDSFAKRPVGGAWARVEAA